MSQKTKVTGIIQGMQRSPSVCWLFTTDAMLSTHHASCPSPETQRSKDDAWRPLVGAARPKARGSQPLGRTVSSWRMNGCLPDTQVRAHCPGTECLWRYSRPEILFYSCNKPRTRQLSPLPHERNPRLREGKKRALWDSDQPPRVHSRLPVSVITLAPPCPCHLGHPN